MGILQNQRETLNGLVNSLVWTLVVGLRAPASAESLVCWESIYPGHLHFGEAPLTGEVVHQVVLQNAEDTLWIQICAYMQDLQSVE